MLPLDANKVYFLLLPGTTYANESIFVYRNGRSHQYYVTDNADFVPKFLDETDPALIAEAESQCNGSSNLPCIFDYVYTRNGELARATQQTEQQAQATQGDLGILSSYLIFHMSSIMRKFGGAVAWWLTPQTPDPEVGGSSPTRVAMLCS